MPLKGMQKAVHRAIDVGVGYSGNYEVTYGAEPWTLELRHSDRLLAFVVGPGDSDAHLSVERTFHTGQELDEITYFFRAAGQPEGHIETAMVQGFWSKYDKPRMGTFFPRMSVKTEARQERLHKEVGDSSKGHIHHFDSICPMSGCYWKG